MTPPSEPPSDAPSRAIVHAIERVAQAHMAKYDPSHDWAHVERVRNMALAIGRSLPGADMLVVEIAALMHDMTDAKYSPQESLADIMSSTLSDPAIDASALSPAQQELILQIVPAVSWSTEKKLRAAGQWSEWHNTCLELHAVQDADRLDAIGAIGVLRCAAFSGVRGRVLVEAEAGVAGDSCEGHHYDKLLKIREFMKTDAGRKEAETRHQTMVAFLAALDKEREMWQTR